jgi:hypothetical protein
MARRQWPQGAAGRTEMGMRRSGDAVTARRPPLHAASVTAAIPPGDETLFSMALDPAADFTPLSHTGGDQAEGLATTPLFHA